MVLDFLRRFDNLRLDIVGFLAILGEGSVEATAQVATLSWFNVLPRLLPAPQAMLKPARRETLEPSIGKAVGVYSGNIRDHVNFIGHLIAHGDDLDKFQLQQIEITIVPGKPPVGAKSTGPVIWLILFGFVEFIILLVLSVYYNDGFAVLASILLSSLSSFIGIGNKWSLQVAQRAKTPERIVPPGDVVLKYPKGAFLVIRCHENIARALYFAPEEIQYHISDSRPYIGISLLGTLLLMMGVVSLGNARLIMQIAFGAAYILLNIAYWIAAALPESWLWDLDVFNVKVLKDHADINERGVYTGKTFTDALWRAIELTGQTAWVRTGDIAPRTDAWDKWLAGAQRAVDRQAPKASTAPIAANGHAIPPAPAPFVDGHEDHNDNAAYDDTQAGIPLTHIGAQPLDQPWDPQRYLNEVMREHEPPLSTREFECTDPDVLNRSSFRWPLNLC